MTNRAGIANTSIKGGYIFKQAAANPITTTDSSRDKPTIYATKYFTNIRIINDQLKDISNHLDGNHGYPYEHCVGKTSNYPLEIVEKIKHRLIRKGFTVELKLSDNTYTYLFIS